MIGNVVLIDAYSQIFRAFYAIGHLTNRKGEPTNAIFLFTKILLKIEADYPCTHGALLFDCGRVGFRLAINPEYKANREAMPEELRSQLPVIRELGEAFGWPLLEEPEYEADDLIAAFAEHVEAPVQIVSSDKDLAQLVNERISILSPRAKGGGFEERKSAEIQTKFGVSPDLLVDYLALVGDSADNIAGVPGIGSKGAAELLNRFGGAEHWIDHAELLTGTKFETKIREFADRLKANRKMIQLRTDLPERFAAAGEVLQRNPPDWEKIRTICEQMQLTSILKELPSSRAATHNAAGNEEVEPDLFTFAAEKTKPTEKNDGNMVQGELF